MFSMHVAQQEPIERPLQHALRPVLRETGGQHASGQGQSQSNDGCGFALPDERWPGESLGVRAPYPHEVGLSWPEIHQGLRDGVIACSR